MKVFTETIGEHAATLTAYVQDPSAQLSNATLRPAALILPGGAYLSCGDREAEPIALAYLAEGFNAFVLRYTTGPDAPVDKAFSDGEAAVRWLRQNSLDLGIAPDKIAAVGFSAGGHLAGSLGVAAAERPNALVLGYPGILGKFEHGQVDVIGSVDKSTPPTFLFHTVADEVVPVDQPLAFLSALAAALVPFESHLYMLGPHGVSLARTFTANGEAKQVSESVSRWLPESTRFLREVFGDFETEGEADGFEQLAGRSLIGMDMPIYKLFEQASARAVFERHAPQLAVRLDGTAGSAMSIRQLSTRFPQYLPPSLAHAITIELETLND